MNQIATTSAPRHTRRLTGPVALGAAWVVCTLAGSVTALMQEATEDGSSSTPLLILIAGTASVVGAAIAAALIRRRQSWRVAGSVVLALLAVLTIPYLGWFTALPAYLGIASAWVGGLLDPEPAGGRAPRVAGIVGLFLAAVLGLIFTTLFVVALFQTLA